MKKPELLAPAGNRECLETAFRFGADAAYIAGKNFGLRAFADNFTNDQIADAVDYAHGLDKKVYVTANAVMYNSELDSLAGYIRFLADAGADGVIISDPSVVKIARENSIDIPIHLSTQANTTNYMSASFWYEQGIKRIVMSREVSLDDIKEIRRKCPDGLEVEAFVHGAMCIAHSGRCLMSSVMTARSGNRGECAQPCRWEYYLHERGYDGEYFRIDEDERGTYVLNSKDLMMIEHIPEMVDAGITSFKVEGRMKSTYYVASVINAYRRAIDGYFEHGENYVFDPSLKEELEKSATRLFTTGFFFGNPREEGQDISRDTVLRKYTFVAKVIEKARGGYIKVEQRNKFSVGETLEALSPGYGSRSFVVEEITDQNGEGQQSAPHAQQVLKLNCPYVLKEGDILRRHD